MNWAFLFFAILFAIVLVFLLLQIVLAILESSRQRYILCSTLMSVFLLLLAMIQKSGHSVPSNNKNNNKKSKEGQNSDQVETTK